MTSAQRHRGKTESKTSEIATSCSGKRACDAPSILNVVTRSAQLAAQFCPIRLRLERIEFGIDLEYRNRATGPVTLQVGGLRRRSLHGERGRVSAGEPRCRIMIWREEGPT